MPGALIDPIGQRPEVLTEDEYERLMECLRAFRARGELSEVLRNLFILQDESGDTKRNSTEVIDWLASQYLEEHRDDDQIGILLQCFSDRDASSDDSSETAMWHLSKSEFRTLKHAVQVMRAGGWFSGWLPAQLSLINSGKTPAQRFPSPQMVMGSLSQELEEYEVFSQIAHNFAEQRPDLLFPAPPAEPEAFAEQKVTSSRAPRQRGRKAKRKAA